MKHAGSQPSALHSSCHMSACKVPTNHHCLSSWSWSAAVMLSCYFCLRSVEWKLCLVCLFPDESEMLTSHVVVFCGWCVGEAKVKHFIGSPSSPVAVPSFFFFVFGWRAIRWVTLPPHRPRNVRPCCRLSPSFFSGHYQRDDFKIRIQQRSR